MIKGVSGPCLPVPQGVGSIPHLDLADVDEETIKGLLQSKSQEDRCLGITLRNAQKTYADDLKAGAKIYVCQPAGNGGFPVLTYVPAGYDSKKDTKVHTHYHGFAANVASGPTSAAGTLNRIRELSKRDPQTVFVLPECSNGPAPWATNWSNVSSQANTTLAAVSGIGVKQPSFSTVSAHSGGGAALAFAIQADKTGAGLKADRIECLDCFYDMEKTLEPWASTANGKAVKSLMYVHATNTQTDAGVAKAFKGRYDRYESYGADPHNNANKFFLGVTQSPVVTTNTKTKQWVF